MSCREALSLNVRKSDGRKIRRLTSEDFVKDCPFATIEQMLKYKNEQQFRKFMSAESINLTFELKVYVQNPEQLHWKVDNKSLRFVKCGHGSVLVEQPLGDFYGYLTDIQIRCHDNQIINCHKFILGSKSSGYTYLINSEFTQESKVALKMISLLISNYGPFSI